MKAYPVPYSTNFNLLIKAPMDGKATIQLSNAMGQQLERQTLETDADHYYLINFAQAPVLAKGVYFIRYEDGKNKRTIKIVKR